MVTKEDIGKRVVVAPGHTETYSGMLTHIGAEGCWVMAEGGNESFSEDASTVFLADSPPPLTNADIGKRVVVANAEGTYEGRLSRFSGAFVFVWPAGDDVEYAEDLASVRLAEGIVDDPEDQDPRKGESIDDITTSYDALRSIIDRAVASFERDAAEYQAYIARLCADAQAIQNWGGYVQQDPTKQPALVGIAPLPPISEEDRRRRAEETQLRRYMTFYRMVDAVLAREAPKAKFITDQGVFRDPLNWDSRERVFVAWITFADGVTAEYEAWADQSYDCAGDRENFYQWVLEALRLQGKRGNS